MEMTGQFFFIEFSLGLVSRSMLRLEKTHRLRDHKAVRILKYHAALIR
jgi:hypothetical protein